MTDGPIIFLTHTAAESGAELAFTRMVIGLHHSGSDVSVLSTQDGPILDRLRAAGVPADCVVTDFDSSRVVIGGSLLRLAAGVRSMISTGVTIGRMARSTGANAIVAESTKALLMGTIASRRARIPLIWHVHDRVTTEFFGGMLAIIIRTLGAVVARGYIANSSATAETLWTLGKPLAVAYPGVELPEPSPRHQRPPANVRVCMIGRLTEWKGQDILLEALSLSAHAPHVTFVGGTHFGEEQYARDLAATAERLGIAERVTFTGHIDDPQRLLSDADIAVHCSRVTEPFGQVIVEALAGGCAVIAADAGGPREIINSGTDGVLVDCTGESAGHRLSEVLDELIGDPVLRTRLATAGVARSADFSIERTCVEAARVLPLHARARQPAVSEVDSDV
ncbi:glycosyltransferase [Williamsia phyllosphaerae]|uniref:Glycosyl transferase n=1 Tax=Williamsia phyllosphaerae TaxID=885042 RepID=A0ABQ1U850_9NOCA|nr:glycosyltransferase [Williamsia phyllosphaerae]GGF12825.1 putative glycosyl transferase [Williamsia phyllosphaerae]